MTGPDLVTFGETMLRLSPPAGERLETTDSLDVHVGGAESNVAVAAARLGLETAWVSSLPETPLAERILGELRRHGVDPHVARGEGRVGTYYLEPGSEPRGARVRYDREGTPIRSVTPGALDTDVVAAADTFATSGITPALSTAAAETTRHLLEHAGDAGVRTVFDCNYRARLWPAERARETLRDLLPLVDVLFVAERDAARVLDRRGDPGDVATGLAGDYGHETVVVTRGEAGAVAFHDGAVSEQAAIPTATTDPVGSGDAFVGGFLAKRHRGGTVPAALAWGVAAASLSRTLSGDLALVSPAEVEAVLAGAEEGIDR